jgi:hypothetical protein
MAFPGVCAIAADGIETADAVRTVNTMAAKVENVVRMVAYLFKNDRAPVYRNISRKTSTADLKSLHHKRRVSIRDFRSIKRY